MQLGTEIGKMTRKLFTGFSKSRSWMLNTADRRAAHRKLDRRLSIGSEQPVSARIFENFIPQIPYSS
jgi:hypothetical protein